MKGNETKISPARTGNHGLTASAVAKNLIYGQGYDEQFLGIRVPLPQLGKNLQKHIAINQYPGPNGDKVLDYIRFSVVYNKTKKLPFFTAVNIEGATEVLSKLHEPRISCVWQKDERIKSGADFFQYGNEDYISSGFQKGHMVRYYDPAWGNSDKTSKQAMQDTFCYTNCCPQVGAYNAGLWNDLEDYYMARAMYQDKRLTVFTGPIFNKAKQINNLLVPINFWKVVVYLNSEKKPEALAFIISQELAFEQMSREKLLVADKLVKARLTQADIERLFNDKNLKKWVVKLSLIESKTGLKFNLGNFDLNNEQAPLFHLNIKSPSTLNTQLAATETRSETVDFTNFIKAI